MVVHRTVNEMVVGSNPTFGTKNTYRISSEYRDEDMSNRDFSV